MTILAANYEPLTGGLPLAPSGAAAGALVTEPGQLQYGDLLLGAGTAIGWRELVNWRNLPDADLSDAPRPQAHGVYPGDVYGSGLAVSYIGLLRGVPANKARAVDTLEAHTRMDGVERPLVVDDGSGPWLRMARVVAREVPQDRHFRHGPVEVSLQWICADPRRYSLDTAEVSLTPPQSVGGLSYPLTYPLDYGTFTVGSATATNTGTEATPFTATFVGPLTDPLLVTDSWRLGFNLTLAAGETLVVDTYDGTVLLNGATDRLYTITNRSAPIERCLLGPGATDVALTATAGTGRVDLAWRHARM